jgi:hypothetical protein
MVKALMVLVTSLAVLGIAGPAQAAKKDDLQKRFKERLADIDQIKTAAKIGETWEGWVETLENAKLTEKQQKLVDAENADRKELYGILADEQKITAEKVGQINGQRNYKNLQKGEWFKLKTGKWIQKKEGA